MFVFLSLHPVVCFPFEAQRVISVWIGEHINTFWIAPSSPCDTLCAAAAVTIRWLTSSFHGIWLLRKTVSETVSHLTGLPCEEQSDSELNLTHYFIVNTKVAKGSGRSSKGCQEWSNHQLRPDVTQTARWFAATFGKRDPPFSTWHRA